MTGHAEDDKLLLPELCKSINLHGRPKSNNSTEISRKYYWSKVGFFQQKKLGWGGGVYVSRQLRGIVP